MRVMGVDPGTTVIGWGIVSDDGCCVRREASGFQKAPKSWNRDRRLRRIHDEMRVVIAEYMPDVVAIENAFVGQYASAALALGHARGMIMSLAWSQDIKTSSYTPTEIKLAVTGNGHASKGLVGLMVADLLEMDEEADTEDESDALAAAICCLHEDKVEGIIAELVNIE
jgi:crossover junction endodeoxyribonuclease RuvC